MRHSIYLIQKVETKSKPCKRLYGSGLQRSRHIFTHFAQN